MIKVKIPYYRWFSNIINTILLLLIQYYIFLYCFFIMKTVFYVILLSYVDRM